MTAPATLTTPAAVLAWKREQWLVASSRLAEVASSLVAIGTLDRDLFDQNGVLTEFIEAERAYFQD